MPPRILGTTQSELADAAGALQRGELVAIPTETVYGLAADALSEAACAKIFTLKQRPANDPLIVHISHISQLPMVAVVSVELSSIVDALAAAFWPGPLTMVLPAAPCVPSIVTAGSQTIGVRMPRHPVACAILELAARPLAAPSANMFGSISPTQAEDVAAEFVNSDLLIIDGGRCDIGIESTVLLVEKDCLTILRRGQVTEEMLVATLSTNALDHVRVKTRALSSSGLQTKAVSSPGQFLRHYSPRTECYLVMKGGPMLPSAVRATLPARLDGFVVILDCNPALAELEPDALLRSLAGLLPEGTEPARILRAYSAPTLEAAAQSLFETLRRADRLGPACILALPPEPARGLADALLDRLFRAASGRWVE